MDDEIDGQVDVKHSWFISLCGKDGTNEFNVGIVVNSKDAQSAFNQVLSAYKKKRPAVGWIVQSMNRV